LGVFPTSLSVKSHKSRARVFELSTQKSDSVSIRFSGRFSVDALPVLPGSWAERLTAENIGNGNRPEVLAATDLLRKIKHTLWPEIDYSPASVANHARDFQQRFEAGVIQNFIVLKSNHKTKTESKGEIIGLGVLEEKSGQGYIGSIYIKDTCRGQGLGAWYLRALEQQARRLGYTELFLEVRSDNPAQTLYQRDGFTETSRRTDPKNPAVALIDMKKMLTANKQE
jgi:ribosomal protein S18 acetylase RimI-like enzyme